MQLGKKSQRLLNNAQKGVYYINRDCYNRACELAESFPIVWRNEIIETVNFIKLLFKHKLVKELK